MNCPPHEALLRTALKPSLQDNIQTFKTIFSLPRNQDFVLRELKTCGFDACLIYLEGMSGTHFLNENVLDPLMRKPVPRDLAPEDRSQYLASDVVNIAQTSESDLFSELVSAILDGMSVLVAEDCAQALILETRGYEKRNIDRTQTESVVIGPQQGFIESLRSNITLVRRAVHSHSLITEMMDIGSAMPTKLALMYVDGVVDENILDEVRRRIKSLNINYVATVGALQELIEDSTLFLLPQMLQTERPDRVAHALCDGQVAILMDNSPFVLIAPITFFHMIHAADDTYLRWQYGTFTRILRMIGILCSLYLPSLYAALTIYHTHVIPMDLLTSIAETRAKVPMPVLIEVIFMEMSFFLINEAGTRMPTQIGSALGIVGALILGQSAVAANLISPLLIIVVALTGLGNYVTPTYSVTIALEITRLTLLFAGAFWGLYGIVLLSFLYMCILCGARSFGIPMAAPLTPHRQHNPDVLFRLPIFMQTKLLFLAKRSSWMRRTGENGKMRGWKK